MDCTTALEAIQDAMDGRLDASAAAALDAHVAACPACAEERRAYAGLRSALRSLPAARAPEGLRGAVMAGVTGAPRPADVAQGRKPQGRLLRVRFALAAAVAAAAVVVVAVSTGGPRSAHDSGIGGVELAKNAAPEAEDPVSRAQRILDQRISEAGAPADRTDETASAQGTDLQSSGLPAPSDSEKKSDPARASAPSPEADSGESRKLDADAKAPSPPAAKGASGRREPDGDGAPAAAAEATAGDVPATRPRGAPDDGERQKSPAPPAADVATGPAAPGDTAAARSAVRPEVLYAVFATEADAQAFVEALRSSDLRPRDASGALKESAESKDKGAADATAPGVAGDTPATGGGAGGGAGGVGRDVGGASAGRAGGGAQGLGSAPPPGYAEVRRVSVGEMTPERRALVDRAAATTRGRLAATLVPTEGRDGAEPPTPTVSSGAGTPGGDGGAPPVSREEAGSAPAPGGRAKSASVPAKSPSGAPAQVVLVIVVTRAPAAPAAPTKR